jgi:membrane-associated protein
MGLVMKAIDFVLHLDKYLGSIIKSYGAWTYLILFLMIFLETGLVVTPFLPGDSLIFVAGTFAARGVMNVYLLFFLLALAAVAGDTMNYWLGKYFGERVFAKSRLFKKEYLDKTKHFYKEHGGKTIIIARFMPIIRTFAPFVAGIGEMDYWRFLSFNVIGGVGWVAIFVFGGYYFGKMPFVESHFTLIILAIMLTSLLPPLAEFIRNRRTRG